MTKLNAIDRAAARLADTREGSRFDERERAVYSESATFANTLGILVALVVSLVLASVGHFVASFAVLLTMAIPEAAAAWYSMRRGVDPTKLRDSAWDKLIVWSTIVMMALLFVAWSAPSSLTARSSTQGSPLTRGPLTRRSSSGQWFFPVSC
ncbi:hypothetical protein [Nesterenkonia pannonica]|uniref:hypothetical protein n=1 Tax=Nesterenkonia pannonica TaxID=1548602 RepID=UPI0021649D52|nr:hypothetical protein [Nesterenkonia pannonica]